ncbi:hypothetical protein B4O97_10415 [Marispirochaeta aestuarii]|uniref:HTH araC/xylS-type domain-containing protein n=1 Tax=Marispirochaeta aestuarii TaxID=1963862 RepID=A0A1Y1RXV5_9SPIO|nr:PocR ligand-binding domain-containing protein [Marispirochaeta aestuarii]ORC35135.1 hypothetical protein B4O97_10415 [Marispirochaeta aestuarii]
MDSAVHELNREQARRLAGVYAKATGCGCSVIDNTGDTLYPGDICRFCSALQPLLKERLNCRQVHLWGGYQAERFGGKYIYFCPVSLVHWASPIVIDGIMQGVLVGGPVLMIEPEEVLDELTRKYGISEGLEQILGELRTVRQVSPDRVTALSELLAVSAEHLSFQGDSRFLVSTEALEQQSKISEYIQYIKDLEDAETHSYPFEKERELLRLISQGDKKGSQRLLNEILGSVFFSAGRNFEVVKSRVLELVVLLSRAAVEGGAEVEQVFGLNLKYLRQIHTFSSVDDLAAWLSRIMLRFTDFVFDLREVKHADAIYRAVQFVHQNFAEKITLDAVAREVYLSPAYFSKVFKEELKVSFNNYLNRYRIDKARNILRNTSIPLVDVAAMVGYEDQSYFSKVFKKIAGVTPGRYRESRGRSAGENQEIH